MKLIQTACHLFFLLMLIVPQVGAGRQKGTRPSHDLPLRPPEVSSDEPLIVNSDLVTLGVTVLDAEGHLIQGLEKNAFTLYDNNTPRQITHFSETDSPASIAIVFDVSGSMRGDKIMQARDALRSFIQTSHQMDEFFLVDFNSQAHYLLGGTREGEAVLDKLTYVEPQGQTALYDATYLGVEQVMRGTHAKRAVLLISDGEDNNSRFTLNELRRSLKESDVTLYAIGIIGAEYPSSLRGRVSGRNILGELAKVSGGGAYFPRGKAEMNEAFEGIARELRRRYSVSFRPESTASDGKWHRLRVRVEPPPGTTRVIVRAREGYYAAPKSQESGVLR